MLTAAAFFLLAAIFIHGVRERMLFTFLPAGDANRFAVWKTALSIIKEHPFTGRGIGLFMTYFSLHRTDLIPQYAHNCFLQIWTETGIFSLLSFLAFVWLILYKGVKSLRENLDPILLGLVCGASGFLVHSFFDTDLYSVQLATLFWAMLGLLSAKTVARS